MKVILLLTLFWTGSFAKAQCDFPVPAFGISEHSFTGIGKTEYDRALDQVEAVYAPIFAKRGCPLVLHRSWSDPEINAQAWREDGKCHVEMFGGLARYPLMSVNAFIQVATHEIGHHLGGRPYYSGSTMSVEGQADYYATSVGMKKLGIGSSRSSLTLARTLAELAGEPRPSRPVPPLPPVSRTMEGHPPAKCRLLTYDDGRLSLPRPPCWYKR